MKTVGFLVEGDLEKLFIQNVCPGSPVRKVICNGVTVSVEAIIRRIETHCNLLRSKVEELVVILDREGRSMSCGELRYAVSSGLKERGINNITIGICDRKIENWMLADSTVFPEVVDVSPEEINGKKKIRELRGSYHETTDGVSILKSCTPALMIKRSRSFAQFIKDVPFLADCWWISKASQQGASRVACGAREL